MNPFTGRAKGKLLGEDTLYVGDIWHLTTYTITEMQEEDCTPYWKSNTWVNRKAQEMRLRKIKGILHFQGRAIMLIMVNGQTVSKIRKINLLQRKRCYPEHLEGLKRSLEIRAENASLRMGNLEHPGAWKYGKARLPNSDHTHQLNRQKRFSHSNTMLNTINMAFLLFFQVNFSEIFLEILFISKALNKP